MTLGEKLPRQRKVPSDVQLGRLLDLGLSHSQIQEVIEVLTGEVVARSSIAAAIHRAGLSNHQRRHHKEVPWRVRESHAARYPVRKLRDLGRVRLSAEISEEQERVFKWARKLEEHQLVVAYDPESDRGFHYVPVTDGDWPDLTPIRPGISKAPPRPMTRLPRSARQ